MATAAQLITAAALRRTESRGGHYRSDRPDTDPRQATRTFITLDANRAASRSRRERTIRENCRHDLPAPAPTPFLSPLEIDAAVMPRSPRISAAPATSPPFRDRAGTAATAGVKPASPESSPGSS